ncbi:MAG: histidine kinase, partial [Saprospiraceae bacterium]|nr:histidine kinase [Saprospiraceae bacterium]
YSLALKKSDKTPGLILRLSDMMEYMLSESVDSKVLLQKDIENLINYLEIEKIRQSNHAIIEMTIQGDLQGKKIVPLLLMPLVENAIKHGINTLQHNAYLKAELTITDESLEFIIKNNFSIPKPSYSTGIGIKNLVSRLDLLYPDVYSLKISESGNEYTAVLKIKRI